MKIISKTIEFEPIHSLSFKWKKKNKDSPIPNKSVLKSNVLDLKSFKGYRNSYIREAFPRYILLFIINTFTYQCGYYFFHEKAKLKLDSRNYGRIKIKIDKAILIATYTSEEKLNTMIHGAREYLNLEK